MSTNPIGANQVILDPRQLECWEFYINPKSPTYSNGKQSAIRAGYSEIHADNITLQDWFKNKIRRLNMLSKAENVLDKTLSYEVEDSEGKIDTQLLRIQNDVAKHISLTLGKEEGYSTKTETDITTKGKEINLLSVESKVNSILGNE